MSWTDEQARERVGRLEELLQRLESLPPAARAPALEAVSALAELYGEALARVLDHDPGQAASLCEDELLRHLLLVHGLHPQGTEARVRAALEELRPYLRQHAGGVELLGIEGTTARLRLQGACHGCPSSAQTLKLSVEEAVLGAAPELEEIVAEGALEEPEPTPSGPALPLLGAAREAPGPCPAPSLGAAP